MKASERVAFSGDSWPAAVAAFKRGSYESCLAKLQRTDASKVRLLKARTLIRLNRNAEALANLQAVHDGTADPEICGERDSLASLVLIRLGRFSEARVAQSTARERLSTVTAWAIRSELRFHEAIFYYATQDFEKSYDTSVAANRDILSYYELASHDVVSVALSRANLRTAAATVDLARGRYVQALDKLTEALAISRLEGGFDVGTLSRILFNLAGTMNDHGDQVRSLRIVLATTNKITWTSELQRERFYILRAIASSFALLGDFQRSLDMMNAAFTCATTALERMLLRVDSMQLSRDLGQLDTYKHALGEIDNSLQQIDFDGCVEGDAVALLTLGEGVAEVNVRTARTLQATYQRLKRNRVRLSTVFSDERFAGYSMRLDSVVAAACGDLDSARELNRQIFDLHERLDDRLYAARVALDLSESSDGQPYHEYARETVLRWPKSSFAVRAVRKHPEFGT